MSTLGTEIEELLPYIVVACRGSTTLATLIRACFSNDITNVTEWNTVRPDLISALAANLGLDSIKMSDSPSNPTHSVLLSMYFSGTHRMWFPRDEQRALWTAFSTMNTSVPNRTALDKYVAEQFLKKEINQMRVFSPTHRKPVTLRDEIRNIMAHNGPDTSAQQIISTAIVHGFERQMRRPFRWEQCDIIDKIFQYLNLEHCSFMAHGSRHNYGDHPAAKLAQYFNPSYDMITHGRTYGDVQLWHNRREHLLR